MVEFTPDCKNCAALCCVALAFDKGDMFAFDKPAGVACHHLNGSVCGIHGALESAGLKGCVLYQCGGAGQRVVQEVFAGQSWQADPALLHPMMEAFTRMRQVHELLALLATAKALPLPRTHRTALNALVRQLMPARWSPESLEAFERSDLPKKTRAFLRGLQEVVSR